MNVSPLVTKNKYNVLPKEEICHHVSRSIDFTTVPKPFPYFIRSASIEKEVMLKVELKTLNTHIPISVNALLDSGATGLFIDHALVKQHGITSC